MLYLICTPIGNLNDLSLRSINTLKEVDCIYAEDTRVSAKLFQHFKISRKSVPFHEHNEIKQIAEITKTLSDGLDIAIMSDAGAPLISDPGYPLIQKCIELDLEFTVLPGPSSVINAILLSGIPSHQFTFCGFVPRPTLSRKKVAAEIKKSGISQKYPDAKEVDMNENGIIDGWMLDENKNGKYEKIFVDLNEDGIIEAIGYDENENQNIELILYDIDLDGNADEAEYDENDDGSMDVIAYDYNQDGEWDKFEKIS